MRMNRMATLLLLVVMLTACGSGRKEASRPQSKPDQKASTPTPAPPGDMNFKNYGNNPTTAAGRQPASTFAVDVDTASYTVARQYIERGILPPPESVRVEEFINFFPQPYPAPANQAVTVYLEAGPSPFRPHNHLVQVGLKARDIPRHDRKPAVLTFVVDVSGSMEMENRLGLVKRSLRLLVDQLREEDRVGIVVYGSEARILLEHTSDKSRVRSAVDRLEPGGSTNAEAGLTLGYDLAFRAFRTGATNRVILLSDGVANVGATGPQEILRRIEDYRTRGLTLTTVGVGMGNYNDVLMEQLADKGDGQYFYVDEIEEAKRVFVDQLTSTLETVARDVKVQVRFDPEQVATWRLVGYENRTMSNQEFRSDYADAGEMGAGHSVTALYEIRLREGSGREDLGTVTVRYKEPGTGEVSELSSPIQRRLMASSVSSASPRLLWTASVAEFAGNLKGSPWAAETSLESVLGIARKAASDLNTPPPYREFLELIQGAIRLRRH